MSEERGELGGLLAGLAIGAAIGTILGLLIAPAPGVETRRKLKSVIEQLPERTRKTTEKVKGMLNRRKEVPEEPESIG